MSKFTIKIFEEDSVKLVGKKCQSVGCQEDAIFLTKGLEGFVVAVCSKHMHELIDLRKPKHSVCCPNCACYFGVN